MDYGSEQELFMNIVVYIYVSLQGIDKRDRDRHIGEGEVSRIE